MGPHSRTVNENDLQSKPTLSAQKIPAAVSCLRITFPLWYLSTAYPRLSKLF